MPKVSSHPLICRIDNCARPSYCRGWCCLHYGRFIRHGDPLTIIQKPVYPPSCGVEGCEHATYKRGYCAAHYERLRRHGDPRILRRGRWVGQTCAADDCTRPVVCKGFCTKHYSRYKKNGSPNIRSVLWSKDGTRAVDKNGYARIKMKGHPNANPGGWVQEHVHVMSMVLGRSLLPGESVHHKDGQRLNNVPGNLELWVSNHPPGQRVCDVLAWAREIIARYDPVENAPATREDESAIQG